jgi:hypothetical protein
VYLSCFFRFLIYTQSIGLLGREMGFEPTTPVFQLAKTVHALDSATTVIDRNRSCSSLYSLGTDRTENISRQFFLLLHPTDCVENTASQLLDCCVLRPLCNNERCLRSYYLAVLRLLISLLLPSNGSTCHRIQYKHVGQLKHGARNAPSKSVVAESSNELCHQFKLQDSEVPAKPSGSYTAKRGASPPDC